jgi:hypothetical protein
MATGKHWERRNEGRSQQMVASSTAINEATEVKMRAIGEECRWKSRIKEAGSGGSGTWR